MKCLLLGNGAREAIMAESLCKKFQLYSIMPYENPSIVDSINFSEGKYLIGSSFDKELVGRFIRQENIEACVVNNDNLLEAGMIDLAKEFGLKTFGPTREGAMVEWSKEYSLDIIKEIAPEMMVKSIIVNNVNEIKCAYDLFEQCNFVVKPDGLTAGKGVKVGGEHFKSKDEGFTYAKECLEKGGKVILQEKISGYEFTIMGFTDGKELVIAPATFDYPYRFDGDNGPGTGGMGCFTCSNGLLPFLTQKDIEECENLMKKALQRINQRGIIFNGILNGGFFKTKTGIKFMEFNARLGDPEALNVLSILNTPFEDIVEAVLLNRPLGKESCRFKKECSYVVYIVTRNYAICETSSPITFDLDLKEIEREARIYFGSTKKTGVNTYTSVGNSRLFALVDTGSSLEEVKSRIDKLVEKFIINPELNFRKDIGKVYEIK